MFFNFHFWFSFFRSFCVLSWCLTRLQSTPKLSSAHQIVFPMSPFSWPNEFNLYFESTIQINWARLSLGNFFLEFIVKLNFLCEKNKCVIVKWLLLWLTTRRYTWEIFHFPAHALASRYHMSGRGFPLDVRVCVCLLNWGRMRHSTGF